MRRGCAQLRLMERRGFGSMIGTLFLPVILVWITITPCFGQTFSDDFNRPDGLVGNGWSTWGTAAQILGGQVETFGQSDVTGGIARALPVTFPLTFSFDFQTATPTDGGWHIAFNAATASYVPTAEFVLFQYSGARQLLYAYQTNSGAQQIVVVPLVAGQENYQSGATSHISGRVNADLSSSINETYPDGSQVTISTPPPPDALISPQGSYLVLGNSNATFGPHFFYNFVLNGVPPSVSCMATPNVLWPPNGKSVLVTVSGIITPGTSGLVSGTAVYGVIDEYGEIQPSGGIALGTGGIYSFGVSLIAARNGDDPDGRSYTIVVGVKDEVGNVGSCSAVVTVPHDQGK